MEMWVVLLLGGLAVLEPMSGFPTDNIPDSEDGVEEEGVVEAFIETWQDVQVSDDLDPYSEGRMRLRHLHGLLKNSGISPSTLVDLDDITHFYETIGLGEDAPPVRSVSKESGEQLTRQRRVIDPSLKRRWEKGIVTFEYTNETSSDDRSWIVAAQSYYERATCMRFVPWVSDEETNERLGITAGHLRHIVSDKCFSIRGKSHGPNGQSISCCRSTTCVHELGHAMGLTHEQSSTDPNRNWQMTVELGNIREDKVSQYSQYSPADKVLSMVGYDMSSYMHYTSSQFNLVYRPTFIQNYPEMKFKNNAYYMMMEISLAHECENIACSHVPMKCENDGYPTVVDGKCQCWCVQGLDPDTGCTTILRSTTSTQAWPGGSYALPQPKSGCADAKAKSGVRVHYTDERNTVSDEFDLAGGIEGGKVEESFCVTEDSENTETWPAGKYCFYKKGGTCPDDSYPSYVQYDDQSETSSANSIEGALPDGKFDSNTRIEYCCKNNGFTWLPLFLPNSKPFVLLNIPENKCQEVRGMHWYQQSYSIYNSDQEGIAGTGALGGPVGPRYSEIGGEILPITSHKGNKFETQFCYYKPAMVNCGAVVELTKENPTVTFSSPNDSELECTWLLKAPKGEHLRLSFDNFNLVGKDVFEIRYFRLGQHGLIFKNTNNIDQTFQSTNNTIAVYLSTFGNSESSFTATAKLQLDEDLCFSAEDRGISYDGKVNFTRFFEPCLPWAEVTHCENTPYKYAAGPYNARLEGNYCRNPDYETGIQPWCYTSARVCQRNYCDPCLYGDVFDKDDNCKELADLGYCNAKYSTQIMSRCAKTCGFDITKIETPTKASETSCNNPPAVDDGNVITNGNQGVYKVGEKVTYKCQSSDVTKERVCLTSGEWSHVSHVCDQCLQGWHLNDAEDACYLFSKYKVSINEAVDTCHDFGGELATAKSPQENMFVASLISHTEVWLGANYTNANANANAEGEWKWSDGEPLDWTNWDEMQPDFEIKKLKNDKCLQMRTNGKWNDLSCIEGKERHGYVCKMARKNIDACEDVLVDCSTLFVANPSMCTTDDFALRFCPRTCGSCRGVSKSRCRIYKVSNGEASEIGENIKQGETVDYTCSDGFVTVSGSQTRGCTSSGRLSGAKLVCKPDCPIGWVYSSTNDQCLSIFWDEVDWETAAKKCTEIDATLVMPKTSDENDMIKNIIMTRELLKEQQELPKEQQGEGIARRRSLRERDVIDDEVKGNLWIGIAYSSTNLGFRYVDGEMDALYSNWEKNAHSASAAKKCTYMKGNGIWWKSNCFVKNSYACQTDYDSAVALVDECEVESPQSNAITTEHRPAVPLGTVVEYTCAYGFAIKSGDTQRHCLANGKLSGKPLECGEGCPYGWEYSPTNHKCVAFFWELSDFDTAESRCEELTSTLVMPTSIEENVWIQEELVKHNTETNSKDAGIIYIGLTDTNSETHFVWSNGEALGWSNWAKKEPNGKKTSKEDCVIMKSTGLWNDGFCVKPVSYACQMEYDSAFALSDECQVELPLEHAVTTETRELVPRGANVEYTCKDGFVSIGGDPTRRCMANGKLSGGPLLCTRDCPAGWTYLHSTTHCYKYFDNKVEYDTAASHCEHYKGTLAMPETQDQNDLLKVLRIKSKNLCWIGLDNTLVDGTFVWADAQALGWTHWSPNEPNNNADENNCVIITSSGTWSDIMCSKSMRYICEVPLELTPTLASKCNIETPLPSQTVKPRGSEVANGQSVDYSCNNGFVRESGDVSRRCMADGTLSGESLSCVEDCSGGWSLLPKTGLCYKSFKSRVKQEQAVSSCVSVGGTLAMPQSQEENDHVSNLRPSAGAVIWLGLMAGTSDGKWAWLDGTPLGAFDKWKKGEPGSNDCAVLKDKIGHWLDSTGKKKYGYVCQAKKEIIDG